MHVAHSLLRATSGTQRVKHLFSHCPLLYTGLRAKYVLIYGDLRNISQATAGKSVPSCLLIRSRDFCPPSYGSLELQKDKLELRVKKASSTFIVQYLKWGRWPQEGDSRGWRSVHKAYHKADKESWKPPQCDPRRAGETGQRTETGAELELSGAIGNQEHRAYLNSHCLSGALFMELGHLPGNYDSKYWESSEEHTWPQF